VAGAVTAPISSRGCVAFVVRSWPRLSQTFVLNEVLALERLGLALVVFSMTGSGESVVQDQLAAVRAPVYYLDTARQRVRQRVTDHVQLVMRSPRRYLSTLAFVLRRRDLAAGYSTTTRTACFGHAVRLVGIARRGRLRGPVVRIHAHFAHDPALVGLLAHRLTGISFSLTAHARDLYGVPRAALAARARAACAVVTCCQANAEYLRATVDDGRLHLVHHGVDVERFRPRPRAAGAGPPLILSVGRLVEKKGFSDLLEAYGRLDAEGHRFGGVICGDGPLRAALLVQRDELGLTDSVSLIGARTQRELLALYQRADVFALVPFVAADGDRDGVPNVLMEAMACGLPVVSTLTGGIPDLVRHGENGLLAPPRDIETVARHLAELLEDAERRRTLGASARATVEEHFDARDAARRLAALFGVCSGEAT
jgi:glycosyltransferase involved in cell wall biosynthesis